MLRRIRRRCEHNRSVLIGGMVAARWRRGARSRIGGGTTRSVGSVARDRPRWPSLAEILQRAGEPAHLQANGAAIGKM